MRLLWYFVELFIPNIACCITFLFLFASFIDAQGQNFLYRHFTIDDGLPSSEIYDLLQDQKGYIWISTDNGVCRFDGYEFKHFQREQGLGDHVVFHLQEDRKGRIWMSTIGHRIFICEGDSIYPYRYNGIIEQYRKQSRGANEFYVDSLGNFHGVYTRLGILKIDTAGDHQIFRDTSNARYFLYEVENQLMCSYSENPQSKSNQPIRQIPIYRNGIYQHLKIPETLINQNMWWRAIGIDEQNFVLSAGEQFYLFKDYQLDTIFRLRSNFENLGTSPAGAIVLGFAHQIGGFYCSNLSDFRSGKGFRFLENYTLSHTLADRSGGLWFATIEDGIFYVPNPEKRVYQQDSGLANENCKALASKDGVQITVGLSTGEIFEIGETVQLINQQDEAIFDLQYDSKNNTLWHGGRIKEQRSRQSVYGTAQNPQLTFEKYPHLTLNVRKISFSRDSSRLYACLLGQNGMLQIDLNEEKSIARLKRLSNSLGWTQTILEDYKGRLLVGRNDGLHEYKNEQLYLLEVGYDNSATRVEELQLLKDSTVVIGTKGLGVVFWKNDSFYQITENEGLIANEIESLMIDDEQNIWVGTLAGLSKINTSDYQVQSFTIYDGLPSNEINDLLQTQKDIWIATKKGLVKFPLHSQADTATFPPIIDQITINNQVVLSLDRLSYKENNLSIQFKSLDYRQNAKIVYRYRLQKEQTWQLSPNPEVNLLQLNPASYQFEVQAKNRAGYWSNSSYLEFTIVPPFWQTNAFRIAVFLLLSSLIYWIFRRRTTALAQALQVEQELNELRQLALQSQMNPHFVFNCLNAIQGFVANGDRINGTRYLSKFSMLVRAVLRVSSLKHITLEEELKILQSYLELEKMRFDGRLNYSFEIDKQLDIFTTKLPPLLIQPILENAVIHAFPEPTESCQIKVEFKALKDFIQITVTDNGKGFDQGKTSSIYQTNHQSFGLNLTRRRLALLGDEKIEERLRLENILVQEEVFGAKVILLIDR
ncbi:MAG: histidine kinase [Bacteroidota bacterium]